MENRVTLAWEQIINERLKSRVEVFSANHPDSQPASLGAETSAAYAVTDQSALIAKIGSAHQRRDTPIYDDRGYLDASWLQLEYRRSPTFNFDYHFGLGTLYETETSRGRIPFQRVGTDTISAGLNYRGHLWEAAVQALGAFSNTNYQSLRIGGNILWQI